MINHNMEYILFLGDKKSPLLEWLQIIEKNIIQTSEKITIDFLESKNIGFIVSYGYRHIIEKKILQRFSDRAINLHISYLPWNKGADPNVWSFIDDTPKGVTIHYLDEGIDTGDIIVQKMVEFNNAQETLKTSYTRLHLVIQALFKENWIEIKEKRCNRQKQAGKGTRYKEKDKENLFLSLKEGWNTPVLELKKLNLVLNQEK